MSHDMNDTDKMFRLIAREIITKQNGLEMSPEDLTDIRASYETSGGDPKRLVSGVMDEFDSLKDAIISHYEDPVPPGM